LDDENFGQKRNVLFPLPQRRNADIDHTQPIKEIPAQLVFFNRLVRRDIDVGQDPDICLDLCGTAHPTKCTVL